MTDGAWQIAHCYCAVLPYHVYGLVYLFSKQAQAVLLGGILRPLPFSHSLPRCKYRNSSVKWATTVVPSKITLDDHVIIFFGAYHFCSYISVQKSSWEQDNRLATHGISVFDGNLGSTAIQRSLTCKRSLNPSALFPKYPFNIIFQSTHISSEPSLPFNISNKNFVLIPCLPKLATCAVHIIHPDLFIPTIFSKLQILF
jgi:hypothetical protein